MASKDFIHSNKLYLYSGEALSCPLSKKMKKEGLGHIGNSSLDNPGAKTLVHSKDNHKCTSTQLQKPFINMSFEAVAGMDCYVASACVPDIVCFTTSCVIP